MIAHTLVSLLGDVDSRTRIAVIETLYSFGNHEAELVIVAKASMGDDSHEVMSCCFSCLLAMNPEFGIPFIARYLNNAPDETRIEAAFALGQSRLKDAFPILEKAWHSWISFDLKKVLVSAISMLRCDASEAFLKDIQDDIDFGPLAQELLSAGRRD
jgi:HEAT repeat protein